MKSFEYYIEQHYTTQYNIKVTDEEKFKQELLEWLGEHGTLQFHDLFSNFNYLEINECEDYNQELEGWEQIERKEIDRELYDSFNNELGIDVELLAYVAQSAKLGRQGGDEGFKKDQD